MCRNRYDVRRDERAPVLAHAADRLGDPGRVAREQGVVLRSAQEPHDPQLDHQVVDQLLCLGLGDPARVEVALEVHVEERRRAAQRHRGAVLLLHRAQVAEVQPLHGLASGAGGLGDVVAVGGGHLLELAQGADLLGVLLAVADHGIAGQRQVQLGALVLLGGDQPVHPVEGDAAVVADDPAAAVGVGQAGDDVRPARGLDPLRVDVEHTVVVRLAVGREDLLDGRVDLVAVGLERALDHAPAPVGDHGPLERGVGLQADDQLVVLVDVAGCVRRDRARDVRVDVVDAALALGREHRRQLLPDRRGARRRAGQEARRRRCRACSCAG